jgi:hypothetical protein
MMITGDAIVCPDALGMDQILAYHAIPFLREQRRFTPIGQLADHQHQLSRLPTTSSSCFTSATAFFRLARLRTRMVSRRQRLVPTFGRLPIFAAGWT